MLTEARNEVRENKTKRKEGIVYIGLKLNKRTDSDIISAIGSNEIRQAELKRLMRIGMRELA